MSKAELLDAQAQELKLAHQDRVMEQTKERRNALEAFIYDTRDKVKSINSLNFVHFLKTFLQDQIVK